MLYESELLPLWSPLERLRNFSLAELLGVLRPKDVAHIQQENQNLEDLIDDLTRYTRDVGEVSYGGLCYWLIIHGKERYITPVTCVGILKNIFNRGDRVNFNLTFEFLTTVEPNGERKAILSKLYNIAHGTRVLESDFLVDMLRQVGKTTDVNFTQDWVEFFFLSLSPDYLFGCYVPHMLPCFLDLWAFNLLEELHSGVYRGESPRIDRSAYVSSIEIFSAMSLLSGDQARAESFREYCLQLYEEQKVSLHVHFSNEVEPYLLEKTTPRTEGLSGFQLIIEALGLVNVSNEHLDVDGEYCWRGGFRALLTSTLDVSMAQVESGAHLLAILEKVLGLSAPLEDYGHEITRFVKGVLTRLTPDVVIAQDLAPSVLSTLSKILNIRFPVPTISEAIEKLCGCITVKDLKLYRWNQDQRLEIRDFVLFSMYWCKANDVSSGPTYDCLERLVKAALSRGVCYTIADYFRTQLPALTPHPMADLISNYMGPPESVPSLRAQAARATSDAGIAPDWAA